MDLVEQEAPVNVKAREEVVVEKGVSLVSVSPHQLLLSGQNFSEINTFLVFRRQRGETETYLMHTQEFAPPWPKYAAFRQQPPPMINPTWRALGVWSPGVGPMLCRHTVHRDEWRGLRLVGSSWKVLSLEWDDSQLTQANMLPFYAQGRPAVTGWPRSFVSSWKALKISGDWSQQGSLNVLGWNDSADCEWLNLLRQQPELISYSQWGVVRGTQEHAPGQGELFPPSGRLTLVVHVPSSCIWTIFSGT